MFRRLIEDFKARLRGERRVAKGTRGRVYARKDQPSGHVIKTKANPKVTLTARVIRADGTVEKHVFPATATRVP